MDESSTWIPIRRWYLCVEMCVLFEIQIFAKIGNRTNLSLFSHAKATQIPATRPCSNSTNTIHNRNSMNRKPSNDPCRCACENSTNSGGASWIGCLFRRRGKTAFVEDERAHYDGESGAGSRCACDCHHAICRFWMSVSITGSNENENGL